MNFSEVIPICDFKFSSIELNLFPRKTKHENCDTLCYQEICSMGRGEQEWIHHPGDLGKKI